MLSRISGFLESVTQAISEDARSRPVFDKSHQINTDIHYMLYFTDVGDILGLLTVALNIDHLEEPPSSHISKEVARKLGEEEKKEKEEVKRRSTPHVGLAASSTAASSRS